jgi:hypothetical protein
LKKGANVEKRIRHEHAHIHVVKMVVEYKIPFWLLWELRERQERVAAAQWVARWLYG